MKVSIKIASAVVICLFFAFTADSAVLKRPLKELAVDADLIIVGIVKQVDSELTDGKITSFATVSIDKVLKGSLKKGQNLVVIRFPGGSVGEIASKVTDSPDYKKDEHIVSFLKSVPDPPYLTTVGASQGKYLIVENMVIRENLALEAFLENIENLLNSE